ncbi:GNAT family N-acetyltransferase [Hellea balneolensis]|uniref:GNAT family N-acetyltransferase n=1 Tax=Hellea balneolensis TaxID=287478 RepID=UPI000407EC60|nr:GNAT family N-acetyltransferase [Hellea balneolensis]
MLELRAAKTSDIPVIKTLMNLAISELQKGFLTDAQIQASFGAMGLDTLLIEDGTYFCVMDALELVGCGGWSRRATLYGGNHSAGRDAKILNPEIDRARIRAMYTHPAHIKRGIGRMIIDASETAARTEGFKALEMAATMAGVPFYLKCGYHIESQWEDTNGTVPVPLCTMVKSLIL